MINHPKKSLTGLKNPRDQSSVDSLEYQEEIV